MTLRSYLRLPLRLADTEKHKPAPDPILVAMDKMEADPATTVYVGDTINDMKVRPCSRCQVCKRPLLFCKIPIVLKMRDFPLMKPADLLKF